MSKKKKSAWDYTVGLFTASPLGVVNVVSNAVSGVNNAVSTVNTAVDFASSNMFNPSKMFQSSVSPFTDIAQQIDRIPSKLQADQDRRDVNNAQLAGMNAVLDMAREAPRGGGLRLTEGVMGAGGTIQRQAIDTSVRPNFTSADLPKSPGSANSSFNQSKLQEKTKRAREKYRLLTSNL
jgi:hypothetical protein